MAGGNQLALIEGTVGDAERRQRVELATREIARRYPSRLRRVAPRELPTLLDEYHFMLLPYEHDERHPPPPAVGPTARRIQVTRRGTRSYLVDAGRWDELVGVHGCWRAEEWWPAQVTRVYWRVRTRSGRVCTVSHDTGGWRLVEVLD